MDRLHLNNERFCLVQSNRPLPVEGRIDSDELEIGEKYAAHLMNGLGGIELRVFTFLGIIFPDRMRIKHDKDPWPTEVFLCEYGLETYCSGMWHRYHQVSRLPEGSKDGGKV